MNSSLSQTLSIPSDDPLLISIRKEVEGANRRVKETVEKLRKIGELLIQLKERVAHGKFMDEVEALTGIPHRSASRYMAMFTEKPRRIALKGKGPEAYLRTCLDVRIEDRDSHNGQVANLPSPASSAWVAGAQDIEVEVVSDDEPEPLVVDESGRGDERPAHVSFNSGNNEWYTPPAFIESARRVMGGIDLDPASCELANRTVKAARFHSQDDDGLNPEWSGRVWMNPPYAQPLIGKFAEKLATSHEAGLIDCAIALVNNGTETEWFHRLAGRASVICFPKSRIRFIDQNGNPSGAPLQGQAFLYFGKDTSGFVREFEQYGILLLNSKP